MITPSKPCLKRWQKKITGSLGFHAPQDAARKLGETTDYARQGQVAAMSIKQRREN